MDTRNVFTSVGSLLYTIEEAAVHLKEISPHDERIEQILRLVTDLKLQRRSSNGNARHEEYSATAPR